MQQLATILLVHSLRVNCKPQSDGPTSSVRIFWWWAEVLVPSSISSHVGREAAKQFCTLFDSCMMFIFLKRYLHFEPDVNRLTHSKMFYFCFICSPTNFPNTLGVINMFLENIRQGSALFLVCCIPFMPILNSLVFAELSKDKKKRRPAVIYFVLLFYSILMKWMWQITVN